MGRWAVAGVCSVACALVLAGTASVSAAQAGPEITFFGVIRADDTLIEPAEVNEEGLPVFERPFGFGFSLVVEAMRSPGGRPLGTEAFADSDCPDLQVQVTRPLGDGSEAVCDTVPPNDGGVPAIDPPELSDAPQVCGALNDLGCRFIDGTGSPVGRRCSEGCVLFPTGELGCVSAETELQFCGRLARSSGFPVGETLVTARVRDVDGNLGPSSQIVIRVLPPPPTLTPSPSPTPSATSTPSPVPTATSTPSPEPTPTLAILGRGCQIDRGDRSQALALLLLVPALASRLRSKR